MNGTVATGRWRASGAYTPGHILINTRVPIRGRDRTRTESPDRTTNAVTKICPGVYPFAGRKTFKQSH
jgi:hypothetical protein